MHANHDINTAIVLKSNSLRLQSGIGLSRARVDDSPKSRGKSFKLGFGVFVGSEPEIGMVPKTLAFLH